MKTVSTVLPRVFITRYRLVLPIWAGLALLNLSAGLVIASWSERQSDLDLVRSWTSDWLLRGSDIYSTAGAPDYPPHAIVTFSPLAAVPASWLVASWASFNIGLALLAPHLAVRSVRPTMTLPETALPVLMFLTWGGFRTLLQFTLFAVTFGLLSIVLAEKRTVWSGVCLALALTKPQIGAAFFLWALFTRRLRVIAVALAVIAVVLAVYCARVQANPVHVIVRYAEALWVIYTGDTVLIGLAQLRPLAALIISDFRLVDTIAVMMALLMLALVIGIGFAEAGVPNAAPSPGSPPRGLRAVGWPLGWQGRRHRRVLYSAPALAGLWSLLSFYHLTYGFVVLLPAAAVLMFAEDPRSVGLRKTLFWLLQLGLMADVPGLWHRFGSMSSAPAWMHGALSHFDRVLMLILFVGVLRLAIVHRSSIVNGPAPDDGRWTIDDGRS